MTPLHRAALALALCAACAATATTAGPDTDSNGIRDDVDTYLRQATPAASAQRSAAETYARALQAMIVQQRPQTALGALLDLMRTDPRWEELARELRTRTINTGERLNAYAAATEQGEPEFRALSPALDCPPVTCTVVVFQNGILTSEETALRSVQALRTLIGDESGGQRLQYALNYNPTEGLSDFVEVFRQKFGEGETAATTFSQGFGDPSLLQSAVKDLLTQKLRAAVPAPTSLQGWIGAVLNPASMIPSQQALTPTPADITGAFKAYLDAYLRQVVQATRALRERAGTTYTDDHVRTLTDGLEAYLRRGVNVVLVAHSQGNLYADAVHRELLGRGVPTTHLAVVGVAVPNSQPPAGGTFVSTQVDIVLGALRVAFPVMAANDRSVPAAQPGGAFMGHAFVDVYTNPAYPVSKLVTHEIRAAIAKVSRR